MRSFLHSSCTGFLICGAVALGSCAGDDTGVTGNNGGSSVAGSAGSNATAGSNSSGGSNGSGGSSGAAGSASASGGSAGSAGSSAGSGGTAAADAGTDAGSVDPCANALFCEKFDNYAAVTTITNNQKFGPWRAALAQASTMNLDGTHKMSGSNALHVHLENTVASGGGRLFADGAQPIFASKPTHIYGRMMMYIDPNGTSVHWTFFGVNGNAEPGSPVAGRNAQYIMSSLPKAGVNTYSFVYGLQPMGADTVYRDCSQQSTTSMPSTWACISFEMDSVARKLRMYKDGAVDPILSIDDHGKACVAPTMVASTPWYGPAITQLFVGAWTFHQMNGPLDVWIDDLVVDTKPVSCPPQ